MGELRARPVLVIGVSGATWDVLMPLISAGRAPHSARLLERGCGAALTSVKVSGDKHYRPQVAWASMATGCSPERHGVTRFFHEADELLEPTIWELYTRQRLSAGVYGWPSTWPPRPMQGFVVPSHLARDAQTWPPELSEIKAVDRDQQSFERAGGGGVRRVVRAVSTLRAFVKYGLRLRTMARMAWLAPSMFFGPLEQRRLLLRRAKFETGVDIFMRLNQRYQPAMSAFVSFYVDFVSHRYWRYRSPELFGEATQDERRRYANAVDDAYLAVDRVVGRLVAAAGERAVVAFVSEHGMAPEPVSAEMGPWHFVMCGARIRDLAGLDEALGPYPVARWLVFRPVAAESVASVAEALRQIRVVETDLPLLQVYEHGDEVVIKLALNPDVPRYASGALASLTVRIGETTVPFTDIAQKFGRQRSAMHAADGVFILAGPNIRSGGWLANASVTAVAPTLLREAGLSHDVCFDGQALDVFAEKPAGEV